MLWSLKNLSSNIIWPTVVENTTHNPKIYGSNPGKRHYHRKKEKNCGKKVGTLFSK